MLDRPQKPASKIEIWPIDKPQAYARNARVHSAAQVAEIRASLREFGQVWPILVREDATIIAGHGRIEAARAEGFTTILVLVARGWSEDQCRTFALLDNRVPMNATWDDALLSIELGDLKARGASIELTGFSKNDFKKLLPASVVNPATDPVIGGLVFSVIVRCKSEQDQATVLAQLEGLGLSCDALIS